MSKFRTVDKKNSYQRALTNLLKYDINTIENKMKILKDLKKWMLENDKTLAETSNLIGIHFTTLNRLLLGKNVPFERTAYKIKEFLKKHGEKK